jgi:ribosomal protein S18 acetylase RimI-like enzyme
MCTGANSVTRIRQLLPKDRAQIRLMVEETGVFAGDEVDVAIELVDAALANPLGSGYHIFTAVDESDSAIGYYCVGNRPMTVGTFDLYWIAVKPSSHNRGIGKELLRHAEEQIRLKAGRLVIAETSSLPKYENTRKFYLHNHYDELARIRDFYRVGDDLVVYGKYVS